MPRGVYQASRWSWRRADEDGAPRIYEHPKGEVKRMSFPFLQNCDGWWAYPRDSFPRGPFCDLRSAAKWIESRP